MNAPLSPFGFQKTARVQTLGAGVLEGGNALRKIAQQDTEAAGGSTGGITSYFLDGARQLDFRAMLDAVSERFAISANPSDYLLEAIRANTTNVPNDNHDAFHKAELLRFDTLLRCPVYRTYAGKPHHLNHRTENERAARGFILDAHYNDETPALDTCPGCFARTAERNMRDETGIHCKRCGTVVKDEFVEILVGIDSKKDPLLARGVRAGILKSGSMGCNCLSTSCNVCGHIAYSKPEFCTHIRAGNKGSLWSKQGSTWVKTNRDEISRELSKRKLKLVANDFCTIRSEDGFEVRKAFENCFGVVFDEYSRVDQPADPKALQREILRAASLNDTPSADVIRNETESLLRMAELRGRVRGGRIADTAAAMRAAVEGNRMAARSKTAARFVVVRVNGDAMDTYAAPTLEEAMDLAMPDEGAAAEYCEVEATDAGAARLMWDQTSARPVPMEQISDVTLQVPDEAQVSIVPPGGEGGMGGPMGLDQMPAPGQPPGAGPPGSINQLTEEELGGPGAPPSKRDEISPRELGVMPPGASAPSSGPQNSRRSGMRHFAGSYATWKVKVTPYGNAVIESPKGPVFIARSASKLEDDKKRREFGLEVLASLASDGLLATMRRFGGNFTPKVAQVVEGAVDDFKGFEDKYMYGSVVEGAEDDLKDARGTPPSSTQEGSSAESDDMKPDVREKAPKNVLETREMDHDGGDAVSPKGLSSLKDQEDDMRGEQRKHKTIGKDNVLADATFDHKKNAAVQQFPLGASVIEKSDASKTPWRITRRQASKTGPIFTLKTAGGNQIQRAGNDLLAQWILLDKAPPTVRFAREAAPAATSAATPAAPAAEPQKTAGITPAEQVAREKKFAERTAKLHMAKIAELEQRHAEEKKALEESLVHRAARSVFLAEHRQRMNLERSPLRDALVKSLTAARIVGRDQSNGADIIWPGIEETMARHLVEAAMAEDGGETIEVTMQRAAEFMGKSDQYLLDAEADLKNLQPPSVAITAAWQAEVNDPSQIEAQELRREAMNGNPHLRTASESEDVNLNGHDKRAAIQSALGGTKVGSIMSGLRN
jgi:hypothetical protein